MRNLLLSMTAVALLSTGVAHAENGDLSKNPEIQELAQKVATKFGLEMKNVQFRPTIKGQMSSVDFKMKLAKPYTIIIGGESEVIDHAWPIVIDNESADDTKMILEKILKLPKSDVVKMAKAYVQKQMDSNDLEWNESISAYEPNALPISMRKSVKGDLMWVTVPYITEPRMVRGKMWTSGGSSGQVGEITVPTTNLAMVVKYPGVPVYKKGDLKKSIIENDKTREALVKQIHENMNNFAIDPSNHYGLRYEGFNKKNLSEEDKYSVIDWATIVKSYEK